MISLFGFPSGGEPPGQFHWVDGIAHCISDGASARLGRLADAFELVWATGWEEKANEYLPLLLELADDELPYLTFDGRAVFGTAHWKLEAIEEYAATAPPRGSTTRSTSAARTGRRPARLRRSWSRPTPLRG